MATVKKVNKVVSYNVQLSQEEVGTLFACMDKLKWFGELVSWNMEIGNHYEQLSSNDDFTALKDLFHSLAVFHNEGRIKNGKVVDSN
jgi:hypothetical protein